MIDTIQCGVPMARIELMDTESVAAVNAYAGMGLAPKPHLLLEFHGSDSSVKEQAALFGEIADEFGGHGFAWSANAEERNKLWQARHDAYWAMLKLRPGADAIATDVCVPISNLAEAVTRSKAKATEMNLQSPILGHVGDGNFHITLLVGGPEEQVRADEFIVWLSQLALELDGTITGEHGIGQGKMASLIKEVGNAAPVMAAIKKAIDPDGILNPGKIVNVTD